MNPVVVSFNTLREIVVDIIDECMSHERPFEFADKVFCVFSMEDGEICCSSFVRND